jgi:hypothetical protein
MSVGQFYTYILILNAAKIFNMCVGLALTSFQAEDEKLQLQPQVVLLTA